MVHADSPDRRAKQEGKPRQYYSIRGSQEVNPEFGTRDDFRELVTRVHEAGMKLVIDWVANHTAWDHIWTKETSGFFMFGTIRANYFTIRLDGYPYNSIMLIRRSRRP